MANNCNILLLFYVQDCFFYSLVFDPVQKTLLADQGEIRVGSKYQAEIPDKLAEGELDTWINFQWAEKRVHNSSLSLRWNGQQGPREAGDQGVGPQQPAERPSDWPIPSGGEVMVPRDLSTIESSKSKQMFKFMLAMLSLSNNPTVQCSIV